jgi:hypothetical protein
MVELIPPDITLVEVDENTFTVTFHYKTTRKIFVLTPENSADRQDLEYWWNSGFKKLIVNGIYAYAQNETGKWCLADFEGKRILESVINPFDNDRFISNISPDGYIPPSVKIRRIRQKQL